MYRVNYPGFLGCLFLAMLVGAPAFAQINISGLGQSDRMHLGDASWSLGLMFQF